MSKVYEIELLIELETKLSAIDYRIELERQERGQPDLRLLTEQSRLIDQLNTLQDSILKDRRF